MQTLNGLRATREALALLMTIVALPALAHGNQGGGGGTVLPAGITVVTAELEYAKFQPISDARLTALAQQGDGGVHAIKSIAVPALSIARGITDDLTLGIRLPYLANREIREADVDAGGVTPRGGVYGIGDTTLTATYRLLRESSAGFDAAAIGGVKLPTGRSDALDKQGVLFENEHQPGSGSCDGVFGLVLSKQIGAVNVSSNVLYGVAGDGDQSTNLGDRFGAGLALSYRLSSFSSGLARPAHLGAAELPGMMHHGRQSHEPEPVNLFGTMAVDLTLGLGGEWHDQQTISGLRDANTGGTVFFVSPGMRFITEQTAMSLTLGIPVATHLNGIQSEPDWRLATSFGVTF
jgi:hypothetical protein